MKGIDFNQYVAIIISDYNKGFLSHDDIIYIAENHPLIFMDTKKIIGKWAFNIKYIKINEKEYNENKEYLTYEFPNDIIITLGKDGAMLNYNDDGEIKIEKFSIENEHNVRDLSGAGDTFLAALVAKFMENNDICEAIRFANKCASWVVTQRGVVIVDLKKIK